MSEGTGVECKSDTMKGQVKEILGEIVDEVMKDEKWSVNTKAQIHNIYGKIFFGTSVEIPLSEAQNKYGLSYGPTNGDKRVVPMGREVSGKEAQAIQSGDMSVTETEDFKNRPAKIGMDVHDHGSEVKNREMDARRSRLQSKVNSLGSAAMAVNQVTEGVKVLEAGGKAPPGGAEAVRKSMTRKVIDAIKTGSVVVTEQVNFGGGGQAAPSAALPGSLTEKLKQKPKPTPNVSGPLGLKQ